MAIDFHLEKNRHTYTGRKADTSWANAVGAIVDPAGLRVADIGCGGGIYSQAWLELGAKEVTGVDFSEQMLAAARENANGLARLSFRHGRADATGLPDGSMDIVFMRALIHHLDTFEPCFSEAHRILVRGGVLLVQERTPDDVDIPGSNEHIRGYLFEHFPRLLDIENRRRPTIAVVEQALHASGFEQIRTRGLWEQRQTYASFDLLAQDLAARKGRSILHELDDAQLREAIALIAEKLSHHHGMITEKDRWTLWWSPKPR